MVKDCRVTIRDELIDLLEYLHDPEVTEGGCDFHADYHVDSVLTSSAIRRIQAEAWSEGHAQALANVQWPRERQGNPYVDGVNDA